MPKVSVIIPLYQAERFIRATLESLAAQTFTDFEGVVVDDGSRDGGPDIVRNFGDSRIFLVQQENRGLAGARNTGIRHAKGELIGLLDADDIWHPTKLARHVAHFDRDPDVGVSFSASGFIDENGKPTGHVQRPSRRKFDAGYIFCRNPIGNTAAAVVRRATFEDIAYLDTKLDRVCWFDEDFRQSEDIECWMRIAATTRWRFGYIDEILNDYRINTGGLSVDVDAQLESWLRLRAKVADYAPLLEFEYGDRAEAYQRRYLARRSVRSGNARTALRLMSEAMALSPRILTEEPVRTLTTFLAALALCGISLETFRSIEARILGMRSISHGQKS